MSSFFSTLSASLQEMLSEILDMGDLLHTASIEFIAVREKSVPIGYTITIQCLLAKQKKLTLDEKCKKIVDLPL